MKSIRSYFLIVFASIFVVGFSATGSSSKAASELIGTWDYTSMTALKNGKPFGTVHFQPGQWLVTFNQDATWVMKTPPPNSHGLNGSYDVHGHDLDMKLASGKPYETYHFAPEHHGKVLVLTTKEHTISASRE